MLLSRAPIGQDPRGLFVVASHLRVDPVGAQALEAAFADRLRAVEESPGFQGLQVWRDVHTVGEYLMVSWWSVRDDWTAYMRSDAHHASHARIPTDPARARPAGLTTYEVVAT
jgi:heme-degrading monooxygenase HmoA